MRMNQIAASACAERRQDIQVGRSIGGAMKTMNEVVKQNIRIRIHPNMTAAQREDAFKEKGKLALEAGRIYKRELSRDTWEWEDMEKSDLAKAVGLDASSWQRPSRAALEAADYVDPNNQLGTLSGTLVLQRTLPLFAFEYPELMAMFTDFSDTPGLLNQTETTRIVSIPAVQKYDTTTDATGRPKGWDTVSAAITQDAALTLTDYIAVPIVFGQNYLSETTRRLFDEQSQGAIKAIAGYFTGMMTKLITQPNFNAYAVVTAPDANGVVYVPTAYAYYPRSLQDWSMTDLDMLSAIMTQNKVPRGDRGILLSTKYYSKLRSDPRLEFFFAASKGDPILTQQKLPDGLSGFFPYEAPYLPTTNNLAFFAFHKAGIILKSRLPQDFTKAIDAMVPGSVTTVTDVDTKISLSLVQYVQMQAEFAEWRPGVQLGVSIGDNRGGLIGTTQ